MSRLQLLFPLIFWATWLQHRHQLPPVVTPWMGTVIYLLAIGLVVIVMRRFARRTMDRANAAWRPPMERYKQAQFLARWSLIGLHASALASLGFGDFVLSWVPTFDNRVASLSAAVSILPVVAGWAGLIWAHYPLDRSVREHNVLAALEDGHPVHAFPTVGQYVASNFRLQVLFTLVPILLVIAGRDAAMWGLAIAWPAAGDNAELAATLIAVALVFLFSPEVLRRIVPTVSLPASPLRDRLQAMCDRLGLKYRDILLWNTHGTIGNAAVMGLIPQVRYVMISDLLLETMSERQIEAVFAHEAGHVMHRHMAWYAVFVLIFFLLLTGVEAHLVNWDALRQLPDWLPVDLLVAVGGLGLFFFAFGTLSRSFERQADVFAARNLTPTEDENAPPDAAGVDVFSSALVHVARLNNMPLDAGHLPQRPAWRAWYGRLVAHTATWLHGTIRSRVEYLHRLPGSPETAEAFDRRMITVRLALLVALCATTAWAGMIIVR